MMIFDPRLLRLWAESTAERDGWVRFTTKTDGFIPKHDGFYTKI